MTKQIKFGRNDPCLCGSGKKYKRCCLQKNASDPLVSNALLDRTKSLFAKTPEDPNDPWILLREKFKSADGFESKSDVFAASLDQELFDQEMALSMLEDLSIAAFRAGSVIQFLELAQVFRDKRPSIFDESSHWYLHIMINAALTCKRNEQVSDLFFEMSEKLSDEGIDPYSWTVDQLAYHGQLQILNDGIKKSWQWIEKSTEIVPWVKEQYLHRIIDYTVFVYIERLGQKAPFIARGDDPGLLESLSPWQKWIRTDVLIQQVSFIVGNHKPQYQIEDFNDSLTNWRDLTWEFLGYLRLFHGIPFTRAANQRELILEYLAERRRGKLIKKPDLMKRLDPNFRPPKQKVPQHPLCPDRETMEIFANKQQTLFAVDLYKVASLAEAIPTWLEFLHDRGLLTDRMLSEASQDLKALLINLGNLLEKRIDEPLFARSFREAMARISVLSAEQERQISPS